MSQPCRVVQVTPEQAADLADLLNRLASVASLDPVLMASELRPIVVAIEARRRTCAHCATTFLRKRNVSRSRDFCSTKCRVAEARISG